MAKLKNKIQQYLFSKGYTKDYENKNKTEYTKYFGLDLYTYIIIYKNEIIVGYYTVENTYVTFTSKDLGYILDNDIYYIANILKLTENIVRNYHNLLENS